MLTLIAPCAGLSSRYGKGKPKYLYTAPCGKPIFFLALETLLESHKRIIFVVLLIHFVPLFAPNQSETSYAYV